MRNLAIEIHTQNIAAGWWPTPTSQRNRGEVMMLIVSELAEATGDGPDDKLPHLPMFDVELADTAIRLLDLIGADALEVEAGWQARVETEYRLIPWQASRDAKLMTCVTRVAAAMEHHRKGRTLSYGDALWQALASVYALAEWEGVDLPAVIEEKRGFNAVRPDHKLENRMKEGGKKY